MAQAICSILQPHLPEAVPGVVAAAVTTLALVIAPFSMPRLVDGHHDNSGMDVDLPAGAAARGPAWCRQ